MTDTGSVVDPTDGVDGESRGPDQGERYRLRDEVRHHASVVYSLTPLTAVRLNPAGSAVCTALDGGTFRSVADVASRTGLDRATVGPFLEDLVDRGLVEWAPAHDPDHGPPVSVVVTVRDEAEHLRRCLDALAALDYPDYEVVVVDDGSTDGTVSTAREHDLAERGRLRVVEVGSPDTPLGIGASRNAGVETASHDVVAFTDADCRPTPSWLSDLVPALAGHDLVGGRVRPHGDGPPATYEGHHSSLDMGPSPARVDPAGSTPYLPTANLVGRRTVFEDVGFPERNVAEDVEVCWRARESGYDVIYAATGLVEHDYGADFRRFAGRRAAYGASEALLAREFGHRNSVDIAAGPVLLTALVTVSGTVGAGLGWVSALVIGLVLSGGAWLAATVVGRHGSLGEFVPVGITLSSATRSGFSALYTVAREVGRYYAIPLVVLAGIAAVTGGWQPAAALGLVTVLAVAGPTLVDYQVQRPAMGVSAYVYYALLDVTAYQWGAYLGAVRHRTLAHLAPWHRFRIVGGLGRAVHGARRFVTG